MAMPTMADEEVRVTVGIDTHGEVHMAAVLDERGRLMAIEGFPLHGVPGVEVAVAMFDVDGSMIERTVHLSCPKLKNYGGPSNNN